jgi:rhamnosyltransferase subunit B
LPKIFPRFALRAFKKILSSRYVDAVLLEDINLHRRARGLPRIKSYQDEIHDTPEFHLNLFPQWFAPSLHASPPRILQGDFVLHTRTPSKELAPDLERFIAGGDRPVAFLFGQCAQGLRRTIEDIARHYPGPSRRAVVVTPDRTLLPEVLPEHLHWTPYAPMDTLLAACKGIVHYGGIGTIAQALKAATPQIALPFIFDQYENAIHMSRLGVGEVIPASRANAKKIIAVADRLFHSEQVRRRCESVADRFTPQDPTDAIADLLDSAARSFDPR